MKLVAPLSFELNMIQRREFCVKAGCFSAICFTVENDMVFFSNHGLVVTLAK
jgi:hypothetical protein